METRQRAELLYQHALRYDFPMFQKLWQAPATPDVDGGLRELYLMRAQIKLFASDKSMLDDLRAAAGLGGAAAYPCLYGEWMPQTPNGFFVFDRSAQGLAGFIEGLPECAALLEGWYGRAGVNMVRQVQSEIFYFCGRVEEALALAEAQLEAVEPESIHAIMAGYALLRCHLALGNVAGAEEDILKIVHSVRIQAKARAVYEDVYRTIRDWVNLTTGWGGDTPRYHSAPNGWVLPVLEDRTVAVRQGIAELSPTEAPFADYAADAYGTCYTVRQLYMDIFYAMQQFRNGQLAQADEQFLKAYTLAQASGLVMPFVEYGKQIIPMLEHYNRDEEQCDGKWICGVMALAEQYENGINGYRGTPEI